MPLWLWAVICVEGLMCLANCSGKPSAGKETETSGSDVEQLWIEAIMSAAGHTFGQGYNEDSGEWCGWYFDSIRVGDDIMLCCDSVGSDSLKLGLVTRSLTIDMRDAAASDAIRRFLGPIDGFTHLQKRYELCIDSFIDEQYGVLKSMGYITLALDYADSCVENSQRINQLASELLAASDKTNNLFESVKNSILESWREEDNLPYVGSCRRTIDVRSHIVNPMFITFSVYDHDKIGLGHGMYIEKFYSLDISNGRKLTNIDLFLPNASKKVKMLLFETMLNDPKYSASYQNLTSVKDVEERIEGWQSLGYEYAACDESDRESRFEMPDGALANEGIMFSFQPYEIDCWAAGAYHFIVPYSKLTPYLTPEAKTLIKAIE